MIVALLACTPGSLDIGPRAPPSDTAVVAGDDTAGADDSGGPDTAPDDTGDSGDTAVDCGDIPADDAGYAALFDPSVVHTFALTLPDSAQTDLLADPGNYVVGDLEIDGRAFPGVGVKWRGDTTQYRWDGKPGFKVGLQAKGHCATLAGVGRLTLDGMIDDPAQGRMVVADTVLAAAGLPVPKATWATVTVNDEAFGLYTLIETVDGTFVPRHWADPAGTLWEGSNGADFTAGGVDHWSAVDSDGDLDTLAAIAAIVQGGSGDFYTQADTLVDMGQFLDTWALLAAIGQSGSYPYDTDDVYAYADPTTGRLQFVPWGVDDGWDPLTFSYTWAQGSLAVRCLYDPTCSAAFATHLDSALTTVAALDVAATAQGAFAVSGASLAGDSRRGTTASEVQAARTALLTTMTTWPATIRAQMEE